MYRNRNEAKLQQNIRLKNTLFSNINYQKLDQDNHIENIVLTNRMAENDVNNSSSLDDERMESYEQQNVDETSSEDSGTNEVPGNRNSRNQNNSIQNSTAFRHRSQAPRPAKEAFLFQW